ncbi:MAG: glycogen/starch/alpha-glucan phosphorylase [Pseudomonadota bacterium]
MADNMDNNNGSGDLELLHADSVPMTADGLLSDLTHYFYRTLGRRTVRTRQPFLYQALALAVRDRLLERRNQTRTAVQAGRHRRTCYLSLEFLMGRLLRNSLQSLGLEDEAADALNALGLELEEVSEQEHDAGLGNGGLGRLAACFLDSCATLRLPVLGYGIRYQYGMFRQELEHGAQREAPDAWLREGYPWELQRIELSQRIRFGGRTVVHTGSDGTLSYEWVDTAEVLAVPYDIPVPGFENDMVNTLRLWSAVAPDELDLDDFNAGGYAGAVAAKNAAERITMVLYPNATTENGQELRLQQQYFLASASLQDTLRRWREVESDDMTQFAERHCFQLNDTHPAVAVAELMRLLVDEAELSWDQAWKITTSTMAYTNHTLLPEALEQWSVAMFGRLLPRLLDIIYEINRRLLEEIEQRWPGDEARKQRMSLISSDYSPMLRMAHLAIVGSYSINGVAELHSDLLQKGLFKDFAELWPEKFTNKTNGVTQRRWLGACNPALAELLTSVIGRGWMTDLPQLAGLKAQASNHAFQHQWMEVKHANKRRLAAEILRRTGEEVDPQALFDVQVKRIHEYKRQLLNLLHVLHLYDRLQRGDGEDLVKRVVIIGGKAAPGYVMAKQIIEAIVQVGSVVNSDPSVDGRLKLIFFPDYNVSAMELICPAADLSAQISTAGKEASGTGNMKLMMNGALTIGTLDGANVEILEAVGAENFFLFGLTVEEVMQQRGQYNPMGIIEQDGDLKRVLALLSDERIRGAKDDAFNSVIHAITTPGDPWMTAADFRSFVDAQQSVEAAFRDPQSWAEKSILNCASAGRFSTDRTIAEYNRDIWRLEPVNLAGPDA